MCPYVYTGPMNPGEGNAERLSKGLEGNQRKKTLRR